MQFDKVTDRLIHVDLLEMVADKAVTATIPVKYVGTSVGVKAGGKLVTKIKSLKVKTLPKFLKENIEVDITNLELNGNIRVEDVKIDNYEILNSPRIPMASVTIQQKERRSNHLLSNTKKAPYGAFFIFIMLERLVRQIA